jgi:hypothetical protein
MGTSDRSSAEMNVFQMTVSIKFKYERVHILPMIEKSIELNVPVWTAYNQWTQFEEFPKTPMSKSLRA